ncbi:MAG: SCP2 sterol-binding domain-containing protein [Gammaproteobacteria bacterium]|nr:MAG: SCP2 sterol-binding domain-containing protein [Gammaproteobacteria bacterium]
MKPNKSMILSFAITLLLLSAGPAQAAPVFMSAEWAAQACQAWNQDPVLTKELAEKWIKNDEGRGYKVMQLYRRDCADSPKVALKVSEKDGKVMCVYGGKAKETLNKSVDYLMWADTNRWEEMGAGKYGPMKAMMLFRLKFKGPKWEAMKNMGPFENFLLLTGKVPSDASSCPS